MADVDFGHVTALTPEERSVLDRVESRGDALIDRAVLWSNINSGSQNLAGLDKVRDGLVDNLVWLGGKFENIQLADSIQIDEQGHQSRSASGSCLRLRIRPEAPVQVALTGHYDTVFPADTSFKSVAKLADGRLHGPGIADMKGGISVMLGALEAFEAHPLADSVGYQLLLSPDEETGSLGSAHLLGELGRQCHLGLTYEPALADGTLVSARKGSGNYHIVIEGKAAHAGRDFASGRNALETAARMASAIGDLNGQRDEVTLNIGRIDGGGALNTVPDRAVLRFNVRVPDDAAVVWIEEHLQALIKKLARDGIAISVHGGMSRPPKPFFRAQQALFEQVRELGALIGQSINWKASGGVCEGNNLLAQGLPGIDTLGVRGGDIHSHAEYAWPESFVERAQLSALILCKLATGELDARRLRADLENEQRGHGQCSHG